MTTIFYLFINLLILWFIDDKNFTNSEFSYEVNKVYPKIISTINQTVDFIFRKKLIV
jgi:hypothetical protein